jgi:hypothetical protein
VSFAFLIAPLIRIVVMATSVLLTAVIQELVTAYMILLLTMAIPVMTGICVQSMIPVMTGHVAALLKIAVP